MRYCLAFGALLLVMFTQSCKHPSEKNTTESTIEKPTQPVLDSVQQAALQRKQEKEAVRASVFKFIKEDFDVLNTSPSHPNRRNIDYFKTFDGKLPWDTDFNTNPVYVKRLKALTGDTYKNIEFINNSPVASEMQIKGNMLAFGLGEAHNVGYNNYKVLYDLDADVFALVHYWRDFDVEKDHYDLFIEQPNRYTEDQFYSLYDWVKEMN